MWQCHVWLRQFQMPEHVGRLSAIAQSTSNSCENQPQQMQTVHQAPENERAWGLGVAGQDRLPNLNHTYMSSLLEAILNSKKPSLIHKVHLCEVPRNECSKSCKPTLTPKKRRTRTFTAQKAQLLLIHVQIQPRNVKRAHIRPTTTGATRWV